MCPNFFHFSRVQIKFCDPVLLRPTKGLVKIYGKIIRDIRFCRSYTGPSIFASLLRFLLLFDIRGRLLLLVGGRGVGKILGGHQKIPDGGSGHEKIWTVGGHEKMDKMCFSSV